MHGNSHWNRTCKPIFIFVHLTCHWTIGEMISSLIKEITGQSHQKSSDDVIVKANQTGDLVYWNIISIFRMSRVRYVPKDFLQNINISLFQPKNKNCSLIRTRLFGSNIFPPTQSSSGRFLMSIFYFLKPWPVRRRFHPSASFFLNWDPIDFKFFSLKCNLSPAAFPISPNREHTVRPSIIEQSCIYFSLFSL